MLEVGQKREELQKLIATLSGEDLKKCYQCGKCTAGCPIMPEMREAPNQILRFLQLGLKERALSSPTIWLCASCETCTTRCPKGVDIARLMDTLRILSRKEGYAPMERDVAVFNDLFLKLLKSYGRLPESMLALRFNLKQRHPLRDLSLGLKLLGKGKLSPLQKRIKGVKDIREMFEQTKGFASPEKQ